MNTYREAFAAGWERGLCGRDAEIERLTAINAELVAVPYFACETRSERKLRLEPPAMIDANGTQWCSVDALAEANTEIERLRALNAELVAALEFAQTIIGHPNDAGSQFIATLLAKVKEGK